MIDSYTPHIETHLNKISSKRFLRRKSIGEASAVILKQNLEVISINDPFDVPTEQENQKRQRKLRIKTYHEKKTYQEKKNQLEKLKKNNKTCNNSLNQYNESPQMDCQDQIDSAIQKTLKTKIANLENPEVLSSDLDSTKKAIQKLYSDYNSNSNDCIRIKNLNIPVKETALHSSQHQQYFGADIVMGCPLKLIRSKSPVKEYDNIKIEAKKITSYLGLINKERYNMPKTHNVERGKKDLINQHVLYKNKIVDKLVSKKDPKLNLKKQNTSIINSLDHSRGASNNELNSHNRQAPILSYEMRFPVEDTPDQTVENSANRRNWNGLVSRDDGEIFQPRKLSPCRVYNNQFTRKINRVTHSIDEKVAKNFKQRLFSKNFGGDHYQNPNNSSGVSNYNNDRLYLDAYNIRYPNETETPQFDYGNLLSNAYSSDTMAGDNILNNANNLQRIYEDSQQLRSLSYNASSFSHDPHFPNLIKKNPHDGTAQHRNTPSNVVSKISKPFFRKKLDNIVNSKNLDNSQLNHNKQLMCKKLNTLKTPNSDDEDNTNNGLLAKHNQMSPTSPENKVLQDTSEAKFRDTTIANGVHDHGTKCQSDYKSKYAKQNEENNYHIANSYNDIEHVQVLQKRLNKYKSSQELSKQSKDIELQKNPKDSAKEVDENFVSAIEKIQKWENDEKYLNNLLPDNAKLPYLYQFHSIIRSYGIYHKDCTMLQDRSYYEEEIYPKLSKKSKKLKMENLHNSMLPITSQLQERRSSSPKRSRSKSPSYFLIENAYNASNNSSPIVSKRYSQLSENLMANVEMTMAPKSSLQKIYYMGKLYRYFENHEHHDDPKDDYYAQTYYHSFVDNFKLINYMVGSKIVYDKNVKPIYFLHDNKDSKLQHPKKKRKKLLVLDLDETQLHVKTPTELLPHAQEHHKEIKVTLSNGVKMKMYLFYRPYLFKFLQNMTEYFEIVVFTASSKNYAEPIIKVLNAEKKQVKGMFFRENCLTNEYGNYIKDLRIFQDRTLDEIVIVDNSISCFFNQLDNGVPIIPFVDRKDDTELRELEQFLIWLDQEKDLRMTLRRIFGLTKYIGRKSVEDVFESLYS